MQEFAGAQTNKRWRWEVVQVVGRCRVPSDDEPWRRDSNSWKAETSHCLLQALSGSQHHYLPSQPL